MCGLIASFNVGNFNKSSVKISLKHLAKRGPDSEGQWREHGVFLGFRRLSIIDLKSRSNQPMNSLCKKFVIVFNGEIYNFKELRKDLLDKGVKFKTNSDTEVILNLFILEGEKMLMKLRGMFSFVIYNKKTKKAFIARDPYGIKPLYYGKTDDGLIFASQVKTILSLKLMENIIDEQAVELFKILGSVPEPNTFFQKIRSVKAGHFIWIKNGKITSYKKWCDIGRVWKFLNSKDSFEKDKTESVLKKSLEETVKYHLVSEVPVGIFLSGGIDSAVLTGLITQSGFKDLIGITIYFDEYIKTPLHELTAAKKIAEYFGIKHYARKVTKKEFLNDLPKIINAMDQPTIDGINTWYASKAAAELKLKVVLSGVGGDELFFGYKHFKQIAKFESLLKIFRKVSFFRLIIILIGKMLHLIKNNSKFKFLNNYLDTILNLWILKRSVSCIEDVNYNKKLKIFSYIQKSMGKLSKDSYLALAELESKLYLRNQLLRDSDWASMSHGVELRTPFVDFHLLNNLKKIIKFFPYYTKSYLLNSVLDKKLPISILKRKKTGFAIPIKNWLLEVLSAKKINLSEFISKFCYSSLIKNGK